MNQDKIASDKSVKNKPHEKVNEKKHEKETEQDSGKKHYPWQLMFLLLVMLITIIGLTLKGFGLF